MSSNCISSTLEIPGGRQQASGRGEQIYKFSEYSIRTGGRIRESGTSVDVCDSHTPKK